MKKIFENPNIDFFDLSESFEKTVLACWKGYLDFEDPLSIEACQATLDYFEANQTKVMISDCNQLEGTTLPFLDWVHQHYFPACVKFGLKAEVVVDSAYDMGNISLELMYNPQDLYAHFDAQKLYTPQVKTMEQAEEIIKNILASTNN